jgi:hypothetical protein
MWNLVEIWGQKYFEGKSDDHEMNSTVKGRIV